MSLCLLASLAHAAPAYVREQDGIAAGLDITPGEAVVQWRFTRRPPAPVDRVEANVNGRPTGAPAGYEPFPGQGDVTLVTFLIDNGGPDRTHAIDDAVRAIRETAKTVPRGTRTTAASYASDYQALDAAAFVAPTDASSNLSRGLGAAIRAAMAIRAARRAVFVYTDGFNADPKSLPEVQASAVDRGVAVSFVLQPGMRLADLAALGDIARATGGRVLTRPDAVSEEIATFLTSGATVRFPLDMARRFFWEPDATVEATLVYGEQRLALSGPMALPVAGADDTIRYLWRRNPVALALGGGTLAVFAGYMPLWWIARRRKAERKKTGVAAATGGPLKSSARNAGGGDA